jgi:hypothetical protein
MVPPAAPIAMKSKAPVRQEMFEQGMFDRKCLIGDIRMEECTLRSIVSQHSKHSRRVVCSAPVAVLLAALLVTSPAPSFTSAGLPCRLGPFKPASPLSSRGRSAEKAKATPSSLIVYSPGRKVR